jgi:transcriptional regulator with XRE-family HTH domain
MTTRRKTGKPSRKTMQVQARKDAAQRAERLLLGTMSRRDLAAKARLNHSHVCRALKGERRLSADALEKVSKAVGMPMDDVLGLFRTIAAAAAD